MIPRKGLKVKYVITFSKKIKTSFFSSKKTNFKSIQNNLKYTFQNLQ
jgi:hypothetical protein